MNSARTCSERAVLKSGMKNILEIMEFNVQKNEMKHVVMEFEKHSSKRAMKHTFWFWSPNRKPNLDNNYYLKAVFGLINKIKMCVSLPEP